MYKKFIEKHQEIRDKKMAENKSLEERFEMLKKVMISNLETLHDNMMDQLDESEEYYQAFEKEFDLMIADVRAV